MWWLGGTIAILACLQAAFPGPVLAATHHVAKLNNSVWQEAIEIMDFSKDVHRITVMSPLNPRIPFDSKRIGGGDYANSLRLSLFRERTGQGQFVNTNIHPVFQPGGCDFTEVFQEYLNVRCFKLRFWIDYRPQT
jgi:hypothetical protein